MLIKNYICAKRLHIIYQEKKKKEIGEDNTFISLLFPLQKLAIFHCCCHHGEMQCNQDHILPKSAPAEGSPCIQTI